MGVRRIHREVRLVSRTFVGGVGILILALGVLGGSPAEVKAEKVTTMMSFLLNGRHSWYFSAIENGWYKEAGLEVQIRRGFGGADTVKKMATGAADFCETDLGALTVGRSRGANLKMVSIHLRKAPYTIMSLQKSGIRKPKDLEGRVVGVGQKADTIWALFPGYARATGIDVAKVKVQTMVPSAKISALLSGKVDAITGFIDTVGGVLKVKRKKIHNLAYADGGFNIYASGIAINDKRLANADQVRRYVKASNKGVSWTIDNPEQAVSIMAKRTGKSKKILLAQLKGSITLLGDVIKAENRSKIGYMEPSEMARSVQILDKYRKLGGKVKPEEVYTNQFVK
jgi:NitT/TauT family transport system substrate-binding protein